MTPSIVTTDEKKIIGVETRTSNAAEANPPMAKIPTLWQQFFQIAGSIPHRTDSNIVLAAYTNYESDHTGEYSLIVSSEVSSLDDVPKGMVVVRLPAAKYMKFVAEGQMPQELIKTWRRIWEFFSTKGTYERAYTTDYERHDMRHGSQVEVYIAIK